MKGDLVNTSHLHGLNLLTSPLSPQRQIKELYLTGIIFCLVLPHVPGFLAVWCKVPER